MAATATFGSGSVLAGESLPETVARHEREIQELRVQIEALAAKKRVEPAIEAADQTEKCEFFWEMVGSHVLTPGIDFSISSDFGDKLYLTVRRIIDRDLDQIIFFSNIISNIKGLNSVPLEEKSTTPFVYNSCRYAINMGEIYMRTADPFGASSVEFDITAE